MLDKQYFSLWDISKPHIEAFNEQTNSHHPIIKFKTETSDTETVFRHGCIQRHKIQGKSILDVKTHLKQTETFLYTKKTICPRRSLENPTKNSSETTFDENNSNFKKAFDGQSYSQTLIENLLSPRKFTERESKLLKQNNQKEKEILPFVTQYEPSVSTVNEA